MFFKKMFTDKRFWKATAALALPIAFQNLLTSSFSLVDTLMIGKLGENSISAVGLAAQVAFLLNMFLFGICSGGAVFAAQAWGAGNTKSIRHTYGMVTAGGFIITMLCFSAAFFMPETCMSLLTNDAEVVSLGAEYLRPAAFSYFGIMLTNVFSTMLRATEQVRIPLYSNIVAVLTNIFFNYCLIFGKYGFPEMGVKGAAIATVVASTVNALIIYIMSAVRKQIIFCSLKEMFSFRKGAVVKFLVIATPVFFNESLWALGTTCYNAIFGRMGSGNYAALTIARTIENFIFVFFIGLCNACAVLIGKSIGQNDYEKARLYAKRYLVFSPILGVILCIVLLLMRGGMLSLFSFEEASYSTANLILAIYSIEQIIRNIPFISIVGCFRAGGDTKHGMIYDLACLWGVGLPVTLFCAIVLKTDFITTYIVMLLSEDIAKNVLCLRYFKTYKWLRPSVVE